MNTIESAFQGGFFVDVSNRDLVLGHLLAEVFRSSFPDKLAPADPATIWAGIKDGKEGYAADNREILIRVGPGNLPARRHFMDRATAYTVEKIQGQRVSTSFMVDETTGVYVDKTTFPVNPDNVRDILAAALKSAKQAEPTLQVGEIRERRVPPMFILHSGGKSTGVKTPLPEIARVPAGTAITAANPGTPKDKRGGK